MSPADTDPNFDRLLRDNIGRLRAVAVAYTADDSDDLLQEILLQLWRSWERFAGQCSPQTWAYRVAINTSLQWQRAAVRRKKRVLPATGDCGGNESSFVQLADPEANHVDSPDPNRVLSQFLRTLGDQDKAVLLMFLDNLRDREISAVVGVSCGAVRVRLHRLEKKFLQWNEDQQ